MHKNKNNNTGAAVSYWLLTLGYMGIIYYLSSQSYFNLPRMPDNFDKLVHTCAYIPLAFLIYISFRKSGLNKYVFAITFLVTVMYGISDEFHQSFVPGRVPAVDDVLADSLGAFLGGMGASFFRG